MLKKTVVFILVLVIVFTLTFALPVSAAQDDLVFNLWGNNIVKIFYNGGSQNVVKTTQRNENHMYYSASQPLYLPSYHINTLQIYSTGTEPVFNVGTLVGGKAVFTITVDFEVHNGYFDTASFYSNPNYTYVRFWTLYDQSEYIDARCTMSWNDTDEFGRPYCTYFFELDLTNTTQHTTFYGFSAMLSMSLSMTMIDPDDIGSGNYVIGTNARFFDAMISNDEYLLQTYSDYIINSIGTGNQSVISQVQSSENNVIKNNNQNTQTVIDNANANAEKTQQTIEEGANQVSNTIREENEREEHKTTSSGNDSVDRVTGAIPADNEGFLSAIKTLSSSMSYDGTSATWKIPDIKLPAIAGVSGEIILAKDLKINFEEYINMIPSDVLNVVRVLCTIALVIFCVKEIYGLIQEVMVNRRSGE